MQLRPRHYILFAVIVAIFIFNIVRNHHRQTITSTPPAPIIITTPRLQTPAWAAFDHAASLRDASDSDFQPALKDLNQLLPLDPNQTDGHITDIKGCLTWLQFYRQGIAHASNDPQWKSRSNHHLDDCVKYHLDTSA